MKLHRMAPLVPSLLAGGILLLATGSAEPAAPPEPRRYAWSADAPGARSDDDGPSIGSLSFSGNVILRDRSELGLLLICGHLSDRHLEAQIVNRDDLPVATLDGGPPLGTNVSGR